jgi:hypothetical protein
MRGKVKLGLQETEGGIMTGFVLLSTGNIDGCYEVVSTKWGKFLGKLRIIVSQHCVCYTDLVGAA